LTGGAANISNCKDNGNLKFKKVAALVNKKKESAVKIILSLKTVKSDHSSSSS
jgi:hypothetical protein